MGDWRVALSEIILPAKMNQVNKNDLKIFSSEGLKFYEKNIPFDAVSYYQQQSVSPYFSGHYRQRGNGFGALAAGIGRAGLPIARKFLWSVAKKMGRELIVQAAPELVDVVTKKKSPKQAIKSTLENTVRKQVGGSKTRTMRKLKTYGEKPKQVVVRLYHNLVPI